MRLEAARAHGWEPVAGLSNPQESPNSLMEMTSDIAQEPLGSVPALERLSCPVCDVVPLQAQNGIRVGTDALARGSGRGDGGF